MLMALLPEDITGEKPAPAAEDAPNEEAAAPADESAPQE